MQALEKLTTASLGRSFIYLDEVDSTNTYLKNNGESLPHGCTVIAKYQSAGKGRQGRVWNDTDCESSLKMSFLLKSIAMPQLNILPLVCGLAAANAIMRLCDKECMIKWPNDIVMGGKKIAGILCESRISSDGIFAVCGIGVNLLQTSIYFENENLPYASSVFAECGKVLSIFDTASYILNEFEILYNIFLSGGFEALREQYKSRCITIGRDVKVIYENSILCGKAVDINSGGELMCEVDGRLMNIIANEASVRGLYGYV